MKSGNFMKRVLTGMFIFLILFTIACLFVQYKTSTEPSTLITSVFLFCSVEGGLGAWIKVTKEKKTKKKKEVIEDDTDN
jgi:heme A synthase